MLRVMYPPLELPGLLVYDTLGGGDGAFGGTGATPLGEDLDWESRELRADLSSEYLSLPPSSDTLISGR